MIMGMLLLAILSQLLLSITTPNDPVDFSALDQPCSFYPLHKSVCCENVPLFRFFLFMHLMSSLPSLQFFKDRHYLDKEWGKYFQAQDEGNLVVLEVRTVFI